MLARRRREKIISFTLDKDGTLIWPLGLEPPAGLGGSEMLSRGGGVKNGLQGGRIAIYPPHAHLWVLPFKNADQEKTECNNIL